MMAPVITMARVVAVAGLASTALAVYRAGPVTAPCDSPLYCYGDILKQVELAAPYPDSKTFVDKPTTRPLQEVIDAFNKLPKPLANNSDLTDFLSNYFGKEGSEIEAVPKEQLKTDPKFLSKISDQSISGFVNKVIDIWPDLTRTYKGARTCDGCVDSFLPVKRSFVVAGGRFREPYYWDSFWIVEGLLRTQGSFTAIARNIIENFLDFVDQYGFVPNGARVYYLNRSQPPLLTQMVSVYVQYTGDSSILDRALPLLEKEWAYWDQNNGINVCTSSGEFKLSRYYVDNNQPRPESYREDYVTANNASFYSPSGQIFPEAQPLSDAQKALLYQNLATGAETGWDYSSRWLANPADAVHGNYFPLRSLNTINIVSVDLNSILYANEQAISGFHKQRGDQQAATQWAARAAARSSAMYQVLWNKEHYSYFDFNLTSSAQNVYILAADDAMPRQRSGAPPGMQVSYTPAQLYPFWLGAVPESIKNDPHAVRLAYGIVDDLLKSKAGGLAATNLVTGQQWDEPNVWPPLMYIAIKGLLNVPAAHGPDDPDYRWAQDTALALAQRYLDSLYCTWRSTGGSLPGLPKLDGATGDGIIFEKYANNATNARGSGGEYAVVEGFGWSNGVLIWVADTFADRLKAPDCGDLKAAPAPASS